ncbi:myosin-6-like [Quercus lobata]|uniref:Uncharacterized protein n=1 Tax=Quercus lobata TaxID=97700 RepID=A0A7N2L3E8_QUELO|nr:myosin-6-like [Quercus lobata]
MAKKKVTHQPKDSQEEAPPNQNQIQSQNQSQPKPKDDSTTEKVQSLKSLNSLLLKETFERRQQVESLEQAKEALESELTRSVMDKNVLEAELTQASDESIGLELEKVVVCAFWETQMGEMGVGFDGLVREKAEVEKLKCEREAEIGFLKKEVNEVRASLENERDKLSRVCRERDLLKTEIDGLVEERNGLRGKVVEKEKKERKIEEEVGKLKGKCEGLMVEKAEIEKAVEVVKREKESVQRKLEVSARLIEGLRREIDGVEREKGEVERQRSVKEVKIGELEKEVGELNEFIMQMQREEEVLRAKVLELEKRIEEAKDKEKEMVMEIDLLVEEKREKQQNIEKLKDERDSIQRVLDSTSKVSEDRQQRIGDLIREKNEIEEVKLSRESEIVVLNMEAGKLRDVISTLQESCRNEEEKNKQLVSEIGHYKDAYNRVALERDQVQMGLDEEKKKVKNMEVVVSQMEQRIEGTVKEKDLVHKSLVEAQHGIDELKAKMESASINSERALSMVKSTAALVCDSRDDRDGKEEVIINGQKLEEEIEPYAAELDAITNAFKNKEKIVEDTKKQVEFLQNSVANANKRKSFWTVVSSATTIFAAASVAYVARGR